MRVRLAMSPGSALKLSSTPGQVVLLLAVAVALVLLAEIVAVEGGELEAQARHGLSGVRRLLLGRDLRHRRRCRGRHVEDDLDPAVAGLADIVGGGHPQVLLAAADHDQVGGRHAQPLELGRDHLRPALGQAQIVFRRTGRVRVAGDVDPGTAGGAELLGRLGDDALVVRGQRRLVPGEEHQILAGRFHDRRVRTVGRLGHGRWRHQRDHGGAEHQGSHATRSAWRFLKVDSIQCMQHCRRTSWRRSRQQGYPARRPVPIRAGCAAD